ncbi:MAG: hypothetical protein CVU14_10050 [Bacteroidetes bacterium HGW-Bacteroidetes-9]|jgi:hypothetical protein|nr:MAG: hypothetical protein CVU14_10050 [Bacteroidetes bacterium HGW-Bacteroidetes-9]
MIFMNKATKPTLKICPRCGKSFECLHAEGCWCFAYSISRENAAKLRKEYDNCLCPECLPLYASDTRGNSDKMNPNN